MSESNRDLDILILVLKYCNECKKTHISYDYDECLFLDYERGFIYRNAIATPLREIGELYKRLSSEFIKSHDKIPWKNIIRFRDFISHHYGDVDYEVFWSTSIESAEELRKYINELI